MGAALSTNAVTVNGQTTYRKGEYFRQRIRANNSELGIVDEHRCQLAARA